MMPSSNTSKVKDPKWTAEDELAYPIVVSRGEPRRSDEQMYDAVKDQISGYREALGTPISDEHAHLAAAAIALDYVYKPGAQGVILTREQVRIYLAHAEDAIA